MKLKKNRHQHLAKVNAELIRPILQKNGFEDVNILLHWPQIVGEYLAQFASPQKNNPYCGHAIRLLSDRSL